MKKLLTILAVIILASCTKDNSFITIQFDKKTPIEVRQDKSVFITVKTQSRQPLLKLQYQDTTINLNSETFSEVQAVIFCDKDKIITFTATDITGYQYNKSIEILTIE